MHHIQFLPLNQNGKKKTNKNHKTVKAILLRCSHNNSNNNKSELSLKSHSIFHIIQFELREYLINFRFTVLHLESIAFKQIWLSLPLKCKYLFKKKLCLPHITIWNLKFCKKKAYLMLNCISIRKKNEIKSICELIEPKLKMGHLNSMTFVSDLIERIDFDVKTV